MVKMRYEKPEMLVETFVATQCVALNCEVIPDYQPIEVRANDYACENPKKPIEGGGYDHDMGHRVSQGAVDAYDGRISGTKDGILTVFSEDVLCELSWDGSAGGDLAELGKILTGTGGWNSESHRMVIGDKVIPSV